jgi:signal peptidase II
MKTPLTRHRWISLGIVGLVLADWSTKFMVHNHILYRDTHAVVEGWLSLTHRRNPGIAFSAFAGTDSPLRTPLLALLALVGIAFAVSILRGARDGWTRAAAALVIAGALGNLGDRLLTGAVTDFIVVHFFPYVFNVADAAISVGAVILAARLLLERDGRQAPPAVT